LKECLYLLQNYLLNYLFFRTLSIYFIRNVASVCNCHTLMAKIINLDEGAASEGSSYRKLLENRVLLREAALTKLKLVYNICNCNWVLLERFN